jgi:hypothetical protein
MSPPLTLLKRLDVSFFFAQVEKFRFVYFVLVPHPLANLSS